MSFRKEIKMEYRYIKMISVVHPVQQSSYQNLIVR